MNIYADRRYLPQGYEPCVMLYPFFGTREPRGDDFLAPQRFAEYVADGPGFLAISSLEEAGAGVLPFPWEQWVDHAKNHPDVPEDAVRCAREAVLELSTELAQRCTAAGKKLLVFYATDSTEIEVPLAQSLVFRPSLLRSTMRANEFAMPGFRGDFVKAYCGGELPLRHKGPKPVVGYCGYDNLHKKMRRDKIRHELGRRPGIAGLAASVGIQLIRHPGSRLRAQAIYQLERSKDVECNFVIRNAFWNGAVSRHGIDMDLARQSHQEYLQNMLDCDYVLCARGTGNYSFRFYEALSCGRIPVFIDSDCVLPYEKWIDYRECCVWVGEKELSHIPEAIAAFHARLSPQEFEDKQKACRNLWLQWLSPEGFFRNIHRCID